MADAMGRDPRFADVNSDLQVNATEATLVIDKDKANSLGISAEKLRSTLYSGFGSRQVSTIYKTGDTFSVIMEFTDKVNWTPAFYPTCASGTPRANWCRSEPSPVWSARRVAYHQPAGSVAGHHPLFQPASRRFARRRGGSH